MTNELALIGQIDWNDEMMDLARQTVCKGASKAEFSLFIEQCKATKLNPFARQIYSIRRKQWNSDTRSYDEAQITQVSIDGFRLIADRTQKYAGQVGPWWCGPDGDWREVWLVDEPPAAAKVGVLRHDFIQPIYSIALYKSYVSTNKSGDPVSRWKTDPVGMLAKCAESLALRRAFPQELSGLYTSEEMDKVNAAEMVQGEYTETKLTAQSSPTNGNGKHLPEPERKQDSRATDNEPGNQVVATEDPLRFSPTVLKAKMAETAEKMANANPPSKPDPRWLQNVAAALEQILGGESQRKELLNYLTGKTSLSAGKPEYVGDGFGLALHRWLKAMYLPDQKVYSVDAMAEREAKAAHAEFIKQNQGELFAA